MWQAEIVGKENQCLVGLVQGVQNVFRRVLYCAQIHDQLRSTKSKKSELLAFATNSMLAIVRNCHSD